MDNLQVYLQDHLAGATIALELIEALAERFKGESLGRMRAELLSEITADRSTLERIANAVSSGKSPIKDSAAWLMEKTLRLKLGTSKDPFTAFEALEFISLGVRGKLALWTALRTIANGDDRLKSFDFENLSNRANSQYSRIEEFRLALANTALVTNGEALSGKQAQ